MPPDAMSPRAPQTDLPYRVRVNGATVAAFNNYDDAAVFAEPIMRENGAIEIVLSMTAI
jgi:hypothetical protein